MTPCSLADFHQTPIPAQSSAPSVCLHHRPLIPTTLPPTQQTTVSELLDRLCFWVCERVLRLPLIPTTGKHLDELTAKDHLYVAFNRFVFSSGWMLFVS